jgi:signal transduction histidine kinase
VATFAEVAYILALNNRLNNSLIKANHELDNFIYIVSHDLRSPLLSSKGLIDMAARKIGEQEQALKYMKLAGKSISNLDDIIREILAYSRNARTELQLESFDIRDVVKEVFDGLRFAAGTSFSFKEDYTGETTIHCDKGRLSTVLRNIISNSVKYQKKNIDNPYLELRFKKTEKSYTLIISDNGEGIPAESLDQVFDMFYRGTSTAAGSGLGLYICKEMLEKMNARFSINSRYGEGTRFTINLNEPANIPENKVADQGDSFATKSNFTVRTGFQMSGVR